MARVTVESAVEKTGNRFDLVLIAARRARQLQTGGKAPLIDKKNTSCTVMALLEIEANLITEQSLARIERQEQTARDLAGFSGASARLQYRHPFRE